MPDPAPPPAAVAAANRPPKNSSARIPTTSSTASLPHSCPDAIAYGPPLAHEPPASTIRSRIAR